MRKVWKQVQTDAPQWRGWNPSLGLPVSGGCGCGNGACARVRAFATPVEIELPLELIEDPDERGVWIWDLEERCH